MKIHIIVPSLPPKINGIGDYTALFASAIADQAQTTILMTQQPKISLLQGVAIKPVFESLEPHSVARLAEVVDQDKPDWVLLQFEQFMYGPKWGFNPWLPLAIRRMKRRCPGLRFALMAHERFVSFETWQTTIMASWQRWQYATLVREADVVFFSIEAWTKMLQARHPNKKVVHLPVGSNIPRLPIAREDARKQLGLDPKTFVVGMFGSPATNPTALARVRSALQSVQNKGHDVLLMYVGPRSQIVQDAMTGLAVRGEGLLPPEQVSRRFAALDAYLVPIDEGVTTRRGTLMTGLQHGVPTMATCSAITDTVLSRANNQALIMTDIVAPQEFNDNLVRIAEDSELRARLQSGAQALYESEFSWPCIASRFLNALAA